MKLGIFLLFSTTGDLPSGSQYILNKYMSSEWTLENLFKLS